MCGPNATSKLEDCNKKDFVEFSAEVSIFRLYTGVLQKYPDDAQRGGVRNSERLLKDLLNNFDLRLGVLVRRCSIGVFGTTRSSIVAIFSTKWTLKLECASE